MAGMPITSNGVETDVGPVTQARLTERGPAIWLAGDPEDLKVWLPRGGYGIVTNTVVLDDMTQKYGQLTEVIRRYLDITDKQVVVEVDGHTTAELLDVAHVFTKLSDQVIIKIPCAIQGLEAFADPGRRGRRDLLHHHLQPHPGRRRGPGRRNSHPALLRALQGRGRGPRLARARMRRTCSPAGSNGPTSPPPSCAPWTWQTPPSRPAPTASSSSGKSSATCSTTPSPTNGTPPSSNAWEKMHQAGLLQGVPVAEASH